MKRFNLLTKAICAGLLGTLTVACGGDLEKDVAAAQAQLSAADVKAVIDGLPEDSAPVAQQDLELTFRIAEELPEGYEADGFQCQFNNQGTFQACASDPFVLTGLRNGETYEIAVRPLVRKEDGTVAYGEATIATVRVEFDETVVAPAHASMLADYLQIGSAHSLKVPAGMHVTEYSTSKTTGVLSVFRVLPESDPYYLGNFRCDRSWDRMVSSVTPAGEVLNYCHSTPTRRAYRRDNERRLANNHVEVATDTALVSSTQHERLSFSVYDSDWEFTARRARFGNACLNSQKAKVTVPMLNDFFLGHNPEEVDFWYCDTYIAGMDGRPELWRVGSFYNVDHIDWSCENCSYDRVVEAVYMVRANSAVFTPALFARVAQERILDVFEKITP